MKLALLSNVTVDLLAGMLGKKYDVYLSSGFDTWQQEIFMPASGLYGAKPEAVVVLLYANAYADTWDCVEKGCQTIDGWCEAFQQLCTNLPGIPVFVSSVEISSVRCRYGAEIRRDSYFENELTERIEELHREGNNIYVLPVRDMIMDIGRSRFYDPKMWYAGSMPYSMKGLSALHELIDRYLSAVKGPKKKCIAVDLDHTLWGGVIGEDGVEGIVLSNHKEGARYKDTQRFLKKMKEQGVMLAVLSKNNVEDVEPVFSHPDMILGHEDFVAEAINWESKSGNIRRLAGELNIGMDAFVFLDDNPAEREQMKAECPEVAVVDFPKDTSKLPQVAAGIYEEYFLALEITGEDTRKTEMYRVEAKRRAERVSSVSVEDFLKKLEMEMEIHFLKTGEEKRVAQLTNKTNQFNVTTKRYSEEEIHALAGSSDSDIITVHMRDKYGDQGLVAVLILRYTLLDEGHADKEAEIDTFLMSCRVMGRSAENEIFAGIKEILTRKKIQGIKAAYIRTAKNAPAENLFEKLGFRIVSAAAARKEYWANPADLPETTGVFQDVSVEGRDKWQEKAYEI